MRSIPLEASVRMIELIFSGIKRVIVLLMAGFLLGGFLIGAAIGIACKTGNVFSVLKFIGTSILYMGVSGAMCFEFAALFGVMHHAESVELADIIRTKAYIGIGGGIVCGGFIGFALAVDAYHFDTNICLVAGVIGSLAGIAYAVLWTVFEAYHRKPAE